MYRGERGLYSAPRTPHATARGLPGRPAPCWRARFPGPFENVPSSRPPVKGSRWPLPTDRLLVPARATLPDGPSPPPQASAGCAGSAPPRPGWPRPTAPPKGSSPRSWAGPQPPHKPGMLLGGDGATTSGSPSGSPILKPSTHPDQTGQEMTPVGDHTGVRVPGRPLPFRPKSYRHAESYSV